MQPYNPHTHPAILNGWCCSAPLMHSPGRLIALPLHPSHNSPTGGAPRVRTGRQITSLLQTHIQRFRLPDNGHVVPFPCHVATVLHTLVPGYQEASSSPLLHMYGQEAASSTSHWIRLGTALPSGQCCHLHHVDALFQAQLLGQRTEAAASSGAAEGI